MNVVDTSAWLAYFTDEAGAETFATAIEDLEVLVVPSICLHEVFRFIYRNRGEDEALQAVSLMEQGQVIDLDSTLAIDAAKVGLDEKLAMADAIIYATTLRVDGTLWTQDAHFSGKPKVQYFPKAGAGR
jgi:predicted nucleic acid-binding protein